MLLFILAVVVFILADILIRYILKKKQQNKIRREREEVLSESLRLDFSKEAVSLKHAEVENPKAKILCVDDEAIILDSFRKILVLDGYSVDTVQSGAEALKLIQSHHYDFLFTDLKMPEMDGVEVTKAVKHMRPDIDVVIITGYASVDTAVETMKYGAMDYVQKPFTEDELIEFVNKILIKRQDRIQKMLRPNVHISHLQSRELFKSDEFAIPGGVFISLGHCWVSIEQDGTVKIGIDDFARKLLGKIDYIEQPNLGMTVTAGQPLFRVKQGTRSVAFNSPVTGKVAKINTKLTSNLEDMNITPYEKNWICSIDADSLDTELKNLKIGKTAVNFFQDDIMLCKEQIRKLIKDGENSDQYISDDFKIGEFENLEDKNWYKVTSNFFSR